MTENGRKPDGPIRKRMRQRLDEVGWTQEDLADAIGKQGKQVRRWLSGESRMPVSFLVAYVEAVPVSLAWLLTEEGSSEPVSIDEAVWRLQMVREALEAPYPTGSAGDPPGGAEDVVAGPDGGAGSRTGTDR